MKPLLAVLLFFGLNWIQIGTLKAQNAPNSQFAKDSTPVQDLDYHLSEDQFIYYYGTDDTARAIIHMFYRKRGSGFVDFFAVPIISSVIGDAVVLAGGLFSFGEESGSIPVIAVGAVISIVGFYGVPIYYLIQRSTFSRENLIYVLVGRERGQGIPDKVLQNLRYIDFH